MFLFPPLREPGTVGNMNIMKSDCVSFVYHPSRHVATGTNMPEHGLNRVWLRLKIQRKNISEYTTCQTKLSLCPTHSQFVDLKASTCRTTKSARTPHTRHIQSFPLVGATASFVKSYEVVLLVLIGWGRCGCRNHLCCPFVLLVSL